MCWQRWNNSSHNKQIEKTSTKRIQSWHDWVIKIIYRELCKSLKSDDRDKWYKYETESVLEKETHKIFRDFEELPYPGQKTRPRIN